MANTIEAFLFQISELAIIVLNFCDVMTSKQLTSVNRRLNKLRSNEVLWCNKVQKEFGVVRFKPMKITSLQQYLTLNNNASTKLSHFRNFSQFQDVDRNIVGGRAASLGRCDQLRIIRRSSSVSCHDLSIIAIEYDQVCIIEYLENFEKYLLPSQHWKSEIGPNIALYLINKTFDDRNSVRGLFIDRPEHYFILRNLLFPCRLPVNLLELLIEQGKDDVVSWYITFTANNIVTNLHEINNHIGAL